MSGSGLRAGARWGDELDDNYLPPTHDSEPDEHGIFTRTEYKINDGGQRVKVTKRVRSVKVTRRVSCDIKSRRERLKGTRFGLALDASEQQGVTFRSKEEIFIEKADDLEQQDDEADRILKALAAGLSKKKEEAGSGGGLRRMERRVGADEAPADVASAGGPGKYVPPSMRGGAASADEGRESRFAEEETTTLRVTNISEDTTEDDLRALFRPFGPTQRVYLAKDRETMMSRGFAFISFHNRRDAERAKEKLNGYGYDHLILKIEWAKPSGPRSDGGGPGGLSSGFTSGYGRALPQGLG